MEEAVGQLSQDFYSDYKALALLVLVNLAVMFFMYRYFSAELKACRERREQSEADWKERYDGLVDRMMNQVTTQANTLERITNRIPPPDK